MPYFPLASGLLTGKYRRGESGPAGRGSAAADQIATEEQFDLIEALERYASERDLSLAARRDRRAARSPHSLHR